MLINSGNFEFVMTDEVFDLIAKNPFKYPRPGDMSPVEMINGVKHPAIPLSFSLRYTYTLCAREVLKDLLSVIPLVETQPISMRINYYPWSFLVAGVLRPVAYELKPDELNKVINDPETYSSILYLEIQKATIKYKEKK